MYLTKPPDSHAAYRELVENPPAGVSFSWDARGRQAAGAAVISSAARSVLRIAGLPNIRPLPRPPGGIDVVHSCQNLLWTTTPWVVDIEHGAPFVGTDFRRLRSFAARRVIAALLTRPSCCAILPWTETAATAFLRAFDEWPDLSGKVRVVHPAVRADAAARNQRPNRGLRMLFIANAPDWNFLLKGGREVIEAAKRLRAAGYNVTLRVVGPVPSEERERAVTIEGLRFEGRVGPTTLRRFYAEADVYVMPTLSDTFGMVFLEAMAHGLPVVALDRPFTRDIVRHGVTGLLAPMPPEAVHWCAPDGTFLMTSGELITLIQSSPVDHRIAHGVAEAVAALADDPESCRQLGSAAQEEVRSGRFSTAHRNRRLGAIYASAAAMKPCAG